MNIIEQLQTSDIDNLPDSSDLKIISELCGIEVVKQLLVTLPGTSLYIPQVGSRSLSTLVRRVIAEMQRDGKSVKQIALSVGKSEGWVYHMLKTPYKPRN